MHSHSLCTVLTAVLLNCSPALHCQPIISIASSSLRERLLRNTSLNPFLPASFALPPLEWRRVFLCGKKKDKTLPSCIDYCGLNKNTIKNKYPLPLLTFAFELLQGVTIFSKLDLRNAYHLVHFREGEEWKTPTWGISSTWLCPSA